MDINARVNEIQQAIYESELAAGRSPGSVRLLAVSKGRSVEAIECAYRAGLRDFGESYLQEAQAKINRLVTLPICWHFIGPIQSNKAKKIAQEFSWVHSVSRLKIAQLLNAARSDSSPPLNICLQVNFHDPKKSGVYPEHVLALAQEIMQLKHLRLRGLMFIPPPAEDERQQYLAFTQVAGLMQYVNDSLSIHMDTLSMGMSNDFQIAIRAGSTLIRLGQALFNYTLRT